MEKYVINSMKKNIKYVIFINTGLWKMISGFIKNLFSKSKLLNKNFNYYILHIYINIGSFTGY